MRIPTSYICALLSVPILLFVISVANAQNTPKATTVPVVTPVAKPVAYANTSGNYVRTWEPSMPTTDPAVITAAARTVAEVKQTTRYVDGLGRPLQTVSKGISPAGKDLVAPIVYDAFGREQYQYAPYVSPGSDGNFKTNPFAEQATFMGNHFPGQRIFYSETQFEASPLNRVLKTTAPGDNWTGTGRGVEQQYQVNTVADDVQIWSTSDNSIKPIWGGAYAAGQLYKNVTKDERGYGMVEFKDKEGRVVLKKVELMANAPDGYNNWLCTYYVYDDLGMLRCVIPPKAVSLIKANWNPNLTPEILKELCFVYRYDGRNRMVMKQVPGADSVEMVYDVRDRLVFTRDGNLRAKTPKQWIVTFYDALNRPTMTALYNSPASRETLQSSMNAATANSQQITYNVPYATDLAVVSHDGRARYDARNSIIFNNGFDSGNGAAFETFLDANGTQYAVSITATNPLPSIQQSDLYPLTYTFYDKYDYNGVQTAVSADFNKPEKGSNLYDEPITGTSSMTKGLVTGSKVRILGTNDWLTTTTYYNDKGRAIQIVSDNAVGGKDIVTNLYDFNGKLLSSYQRHQAPRSSLTTETPVLTLLSYDAAGRVTAVKKRLKDELGGQKTVAENSYDELGQLKKKRLGVTSSTGQLETLTYDYNIRGWLRGINKDYVNNVSGATNWFGQELNYDSGFVANQYNGSIAGTKWKSKSNNIARAYGFEYDPVNRVTSAYFSQQNTPNSPATALWEKNVVDFGVSGLTYDDNGNIGKMDQQGMDGTAIVALDKLTYTYKTNSNKLARVAEASTVATKLGDFKKGTHTGDDYEYDVNGNLTLDNNKNISAISYNHLNLPESITIRNKGNIKYLYDATGNKLRKTVTDNTFTPAKTTITDYAGGFVYQNDTLQFLGHEEGRVRLVYESGMAPAYWYDYFVKDHLGNVRTVLTEQTSFTMYAATMETSAAAKENALFSNIDNSRTAKPIGYPDDQTTQQNDFVAKLNAKDGGKKIGPSLVLKVMAGDTIKIGAKAFYKSQGPQEDNRSVPVDDMLASLAQAFGGSATEDAGHTSMAVEPTSPFTNNFTSSDYQRLQQKDPNQQLAGKPKAYMNFVLFDDQFNLVEENSGVKQVQGEADQLQTLAKDDLVIEKSGFLYVYTSNETPQEVFFDNVTVAQISGPLLEETHYYPFGLTMAGISNNALKGANYPENKMKYNGIELQSKEFGDGSGLEWYDYGARMYDAQIGRWHVIDPMSEIAPNWTPFRYGYNNPITFVDIMGLSEQAITAWYKTEGGQVLFNPNVNSQSDLENLGIKGTFLGKEGYGIDESSGEVIHYNLDGSKTTGAITLPEVTVSTGLINGFPSEMVLKARNFNYHRTSWNAFQDAVGSQERSFKFINNYFAPIVTTIATSGLQGMASAGVFRGLGENIVWNAGATNSTMVGLANVNASIRALGMSNKAAGSFFGWGNGFNTKTAADFTRQGLEAAGVTKEGLTALMNSYHQVAQYAASNPSAFVRYQQLKEILILFN